MSMAMRIFWVIVLLFFTGGCSGFKQVGAPRLGPEDPYLDIMESLERGDKVRLTLEGGVTITGKVRSRTRDFLTIEVESEPPSRQAIPVREIMILERGVRWGNAKPIVAVVLVMGVAVGVIVLLGIRSSTL